MKIKANFYPVIIGVFSFLILGKTTFSETANLSDNIYKKISVSVCDSLIKANETNPNFVILDVRRFTEWNPDHLNGSINRNYYDPDFEDQLDSLPKNKIFLIHCQSGGRSAGAFLKMQNHNFAQVYDMIGGMNAWKGASYSTTPVHAPKLMQVPINGISTGTVMYNVSDTLNFTVTNRANDTLKFASIQLPSETEFASNFDLNTQLPGAEDYTFSVIYSPKNILKDSTTITIESNGGQLVLNIILKNSSIQNIGSDNINALLVYPNPAKNNLFIKNNSLQTIKEISIININGQIVLNKTHISSTEGINISGLQNGVYFVQIKSDKLTVAKKFLINR